MPEPAMGKQLQLKELTGKTNTIMLELLRDTQLSALQRLIMKRNAFNVSSFLDDYATILIEILPG
jgi:hypothetical protein